MKRLNPRLQRLAALALLGFALLNFPLFGLATGTLFGIPAAYAYLFGVWLSLIIAAAFITEGRSK